MQTIRYQARATNVGYQVWDLQKGEWCFGTWSKSYAVASQIATAYNAALNDWRNKK